jgi:hypothetical protein
MYSVDSVIAVAAPGSFPLADRRKAILAYLHLSHSCSILA